MTLTAVSMLRIRHPRAFAALAVAMLLLGSCGSGEGESPAETAAPPIESAGIESTGDAAGAGSEPESETEAEAPPDPAEPDPAEQAPAEPDAAAPSPPPSPPPRPSPVADAPPPRPREEPALTPEEAIERASRPPVGAEVRSLLACGDVAEAYRRLMEENRTCTSDGDCRVVEGSCAIGLGGCWYAVSRSVTFDDADRLSARYRELACTGAVCRCAAPPERAVCEQGVCTAGS